MGPEVAVGAVVLVGDRILLVQRKNPPNQGGWSFPGGRVERGEPLVEAVRREVLEETGLDVVATDLIEVFEVVDATYHYVILDYLAAPTRPNQTLRAGDDALDARFVPLADLDTYALSEAMHRVIGRAAAKLGAHG